MNGHFAFKKAHVEESPPMKLQVYWNFQFASMFSNFSIWTVQNFWIKSFYPYGHRATWTSLIILGITFFATSLYSKVWYLQRVSSSDFKQTEKKVPDFKVPNCLPIRSKTVHSQTLDYKFWSPNISFALNQSFSLKRPIDTRQWKLSNAVDQFEFLWR